MGRGLLGAVADNLRRDRLMQLRYWTTGLIGSISLTTTGWLCTEAKPGVLDG